MSIFTDNLTNILKRRGMKKAEFLRELGLGKNSFTQWRDNGNIPRVDTLKQMAAMLGVEIGDLTGEEISEKSLSSTEQELIRIFRTLSENSQQRVVGRLQEIADQERGIVQKPKMGNSLTSSGTEVIEKEAVNDSN